MLRILLVVLALSGRAHAGLFCEDEPAMKDLEALAADKTKLEQADRDYAWLCVEGAADRLKPRIEKACRTILDRDGEQNQCVTVAAAAGIGTLGDHDIYTLVTKLREDPIEASGGVGFYKAMLLARIGDPRGAQFLVDLWRATIPRADAREKRHREMRSWSGWRQYTAEALGTLGDADTKAFLEEQAKATKDTHVAEACTKAATAIGKRLTKP